MTDENERVEEEVQPEQALRVAGIHDDGRHLLVTVAVKAVMDSLGVDDVVFLIDLPEYQRVAHGSRVERVESYLVALHGTDDAMLREEAQQLVG